MQLQITIGNEADAQRAVNLLQQYLQNGTPVATQAPVEAPATPPTEAPAEAPATAPTEAPATAAQGDVEVDVNGTPWIAAVHAGSKVKNQDGSWRKKRGVDEAEYKQAEAKARGEIDTIPPTNPVPEQAAQAELPMDEPMQPTITMEEVSQVWGECVSAGVVSVEAAMDMYRELGVAPATLPTNETDRRKLFDHLTGLLG